MDFKRATLYAALVIVAYFIVLQWNEDYHKPVEANNAITNAIETTQNNHNSNLTLDNSNSKVQNGQNLNSDDEKGISEDLNFSKPNTQIQPENLATNALVKASENLIKVRTSNFDLKIDLNGGDIVEAKLRKYKETLKSPKEFTLLENNKTFYVVQSELQGVAKGRINYSAESQNYDFSKTNNETYQLVLNAEQDNIFVKKIFTFSQDSYLIKVKYEVENKSANSVNPSFLGLIKRDNSEDPSQAQGVGVSAFLGAAYSTDSQKYEKLEFSKFEKERLNETTNKGWLAILQHYFISAWIFDSSKQNQVTTAKDKNGNNVIGFLSSAIEIAPNSNGALENSVYLGPKVQTDLKQAAPNLDLTVDFGWLWFISQPLFWILDFIENFVGNWGIAIILLTLLIKIAFFQLSATSYKSMARMKKVAPKMQKIKEQYGDDKQKQSQAMMDLYRKEKINPMGGCLPILVQMPVFIALYWMLMESIELRQAPFFFWIEDLSVKDPYFILPILMGATMFLQQLLNPPPPDPMQAKLMKLLPVIFTVFFLWFPAGLVLYWLVNNVLSILQQWIITKNIEKEETQKN